MVEQANAEGILLWENGSEPRTVDPHLSTSKSTSAILYSLFDSLVVSDPKTGLPSNKGAAESWEISEDRLTYTFKLRPDGVWSNGDPVTAQHFAYSFERILSKRLASRYSYMLYPIKNAEEFNKGEISDFSEVGVKVIDDLTLELTLSSQTPYLLDLMTHCSWQPVYPPAVEKHGGMLDINSRWTRPENIVTNGGFLMKEWIPNKHLKVVKNPKHWDAENIRLNGVTYYPIENRETAQRAFRREAVHSTYTIPPHRVVWGKKNLPEQMRISPALGVYFYRVNIGEPKPGESEERKAIRKTLSDKRVRQALSYAMDRESICDFLKAGQQPATHFVPPGTSTYKSPDVLSYDPEKARKLLAEAGYPEGKGFPKFELIYNTDEAHKHIAEILQEQWSKTLGIDITLANQEWKVYLNTVHSMDYQMARASWFGDYNDPNTFLDMWLTGGGNNETGFSNKRYDDLIKQAALAGAEPEKRLAIFQEAEEILLDELPIIPIYFYVNQHMVHPSVLNWNDNVMDDHYFRFMDVKRP